MKERFLLQVFFQPYRDMGDAHGAESRDKNSEA